MTVRPGQIILLLAVVAFAIYATRIRSSLTDRIIYLLFVIAGIPLVLYPDWTTRVANLVGIGRGVDLVIYLFIAYCLFFFASSASHFRKVERDLTLVVRALAIERAARGPADSGAPDATGVGTQPGGSAPS